MNSGSDNVDSQSKGGSIGTTWCYGSRTDTGIKSLKSVCVTAMVGEGSCASPKNERTEDGTGKLNNPVQESAHDALFSHDDEGQRDSRIDVASGDMTNAVRENGDSETEGDSDTKLTRWTIQNANFCCRTYGEKYLSFLDDCRCRSVGKAIL